MDFIHSFSPNYSGFYWFKPLSSHIPESFSFAFDFQNGTSFSEYLQSFLWLIMERAHIAHCAII